MFVFFFGNEVPGMPFSVAVNSMYNRTNRTTRRLHNRDEESQDRPAHTCRQTHTCRITPAPRKHSLPLATPNLAVCLCRSLSSPSRAEPD